MLLIAIDTSGRQGSLALCRGDQLSFELLQLTSLEGGNYSADLMPQIAGVLERRKLPKSEVDAFVVVSGPGSFTGLRVGLATVKGLCEVLQKPLAAVSMLEALAVTYGRAGKTTTALLDAGRGEIYVGEYQVLRDSATPLREYTAKLAEFAALSDINDRRIITPEPSIADLLRSHSVRAEAVVPVQADQVGRIGLRKLLVGDIADAASVDVNYIRRSDAELYSAAKR